MPNKANGHDDTTDTPTSDTTPTDAPSEEELERNSEEAFAADAAEDLPSSGLLSFYDRLRERIVAKVEGRGGRFTEGTVRALLLVPDVFMLLVRLSLDKEVPAQARMLIGGALAYFVLPMDLLPEALVGVGGYVDDLVLATAVLAQAFSGELEPYARKHWSGSEDLRVVLADVSYAAENLLGAKLFNRLKGLMEKRGIKLPEST
jgi:uncharacterized membrane protein YkvA (DUF1232 family)